MGEPSVYYRDKIPKEPNHKLLMSEFLRLLSVNGFTIISVDTEYQGFREDYGLIPDMRIIIEYNREKYVVFPPVLLDVTMNISGVLLLISFIERSLAPS